VNGASPESRTDGPIVRYNQDMRSHNRPPRPAAALTVAAALAAIVAAQAPLPRAHAGDPPAPPARGRSAEYRQAVQAIEAVKKKKPAAVSTGDYTDGGIENAAELPVKGFGYRLVSATRKTRFGSDGMVFGLIEVAALLQERRPKSPWLSIGDISSEKGGKLSPHINHQDGCDVDMSFLYCTEKGEPMERTWLKCDDQGKAKGNVRFDAARNWELLDLLVTSPYTGGCEWIFVYAPLKKLVVEHGRALAKANPKKADAINASTDVLEALLREPTSSPHADHFHIRVKKGGPPAPETPAPEETMPEGKKPGGAKPGAKPKPPAEPETPSEPETPAEPETPGRGGDEDDDEDE